MTLGYVVLLAATLLAGCSADAIEDVSPAHIASQENLVVPLHERALVMIDRGELVEAEFLLADVVRGRPEDGYARNNLGCVYYWQRRWEPAAVEFRAALHSLDFHPTPRQNLALTLRQLSTGPVHPSTQQPTRGVSPVDSPPHSFDVQLIEGP